MRIEKQMRLGAVLFTAMIGLMIYGEIHEVMADHDQKVALDRGTYTRVRTVSPSSYTGTAVWPGTDSGKLMDSTCVLNSANKVWLGTSTVSTLDTVVQSNISNGIPITSTQSFSFNGAFSGGDIQATCDSGKSSCEIRCLDQLNR